eukprot:scaffold96263_cov17-Prasinocladus_malaysianus.AAC.1
MTSPTKLFETTLWHEIRRNCKSFRAELGYCPSPYPALSCTTRGARSTNWNADGNKTAVNGYKSK